MVTEISTSDAKLGKEFIKIFNFISGKIFKKLTNLEFYNINKVLSKIITYLFTQICKHLCYFKNLFILCNIFRNYKFSKIINIKKI